MHFSRACPVGAADYLRLCAQSLTHSKPALGAKMPSPQSAAGSSHSRRSYGHHLARLVYRMLRYEENYVEKVIQHYEHKFRLQRIKWLKKEARALNLQLVAA